MRAVIINTGLEPRLDEAAPLVEVQGKTLLTRQLAALRAAGANEVAVVTDRDSEAFDGLGVLHFTSVRPTITGSLEACREWLADDKVLVSYGDTVYGADTVRSLATAGAPLAISYDPDHLDDPHGSFRLRRDGSVAEIGSGETSADHLQGRYIGLLRFTPDGWAATERALAAADRPDVDLAGLLSLVIGRDEVSVEAVPVAGPWLEFSGTDDQATRTVLDQLDRDDAHVLFVLGLGSHGPRQLIASTAVADRITWLYNPDELPDPKRDIPAMEACRGAAPYRGPVEAVAAAERVHANDPVAGVVTLSESAVTTVALIAEALGVRGNPVAAARRIANKFEQRSALAAAGVPTQPFARIDTTDDLPAAVEAVGFPAVLKPVFGAGSRLVTRVDDLAALEAAWQRAEAFFAEAKDSYDLRLLTRGEQPFFLLEGLLESAGPRPGGLGDYFSVESAVYGGEITHLAVTDRWPLTTAFRETGIFLPHSLPDDVAKAGEELAAAAIAACGFTDGITHIEMKLTPDGPRIIEVNGRIGGPMGPILQLASGYDYVAQAVRAAVGAGPMTRPVVRRHVALSFPVIDKAYSGQRVKIEIDPEFELQPGVAAVYSLPFRKFDATLGEGHVCHAYLTAPDRDSLAAMRDDLYRSIHVLIGDTEVVPTPLDRVAP